MKLLIVYASEIEYTPTVKTLDEFEIIENGESYKNLLVAFIHAEEQDQENAKGVENKMLKNLKWAAKKNNTKNILLHSFAHLSDSKASPKFTKELFDKIELRLKNADYICNQTPFGYFLDLDIKLPGVSQARIFKSF